MNKGIQWRLKWEMISGHKGIDLLISEDVPRTRVVSSPRATEEIDNEEKGPSTRVGVKRVLSIHRAPQLLRPQT